MSTNRLQQNYYKRKVLLFYRSIQALCLLIKPFLSSQDHQLFLFQLNVSRTFE